MNKYNRRLTNCLSRGKEGSVLAVYGGGGKRWIPSGRTHHHVYGFRSRTVICADVALIYMIRNSS